MSKAIVTLDFTSWSEFMNHLDEHHRNSRGLIFRGQANSNWKVESTLLRQVKLRLDTILQEATPEEVAYQASHQSKTFGANIMQSFRMHLGQTSAVNLANEDEWLLGRHHGLFSPILDWTRSPYVAAFFAAADVVMNPPTTTDGHFAVWSMSTLLFDAHSRIHVDPSSRRTLRVFEAAKLGNSRGIAQQGVGTFIDPDLDLVSLASEVGEDNLARESLRCFRLPFSQAENAINHLYLMNIHFRTLYPDSIGLALQANMNLHHFGYEGMGGWSTPPGYETLLAK